MAAFINTGLKKKEKKRETQWHLRNNRISPNASLLQSDQQHRAHPKRSGKSAGTTKDYLSRHGFGQKHRHVVPALKHTDVPESKRELLGRSLWILVYLDEKYADKVIDDMSDIVTRVKSKNDGSAHQARQDKNY